MKKIILILVLAPLYSFANELECPDDGYIVSYRSPTSGNKISFCQIKINGKRFKHGPEEILNDDGSVVSRKYYEKGEEVQPHKIAKEPAADETDISFNKIAEIIETILSSMIVFDPDSESKLSIKGCKNYIKKWKRVFISNKKETFKYKFGNDCDIEGIILASKNKININLSLRNVGEFERVSMGVPYNVLLGARPKVTFTIKDGLVLSEGEKKCEFSGTYDLIVDPFSRNLVHQDLGGKILFETYDGKEVNHQVKIKII